MSAIGVQDNMRLSHSLPSPSATTPSVLYGTWINMATMCMCVFVLKSTIDTTIWVNKEGRNIISETTYLRERHEIRGRGMMKRWERRTSSRCVNWRERIEKRGERRGRTWHVFVSFQSQTFEGNGKSSNHHHLEVFKWSEWRFELEPKCNLFLILLSFAPSVFLLLVLTNV